jgi:hypothetical protein
VAGNIRKNPQPGARCRETPPETHWRELYHFVESFYPKKRATPEKAQSNESHFNYSRHFAGFFNKKSAPLFSG